MIPILVKILPTGFIGDLLGLIILAGIAGVALEALGIPVFAPAWVWVETSLIDPVISWLQGVLTPW